MNKKWKTAIVSAVCAVGAVIIATGSCFVYTWVVPREAPVTAGGWNMNAVYDDSEISFLTKQDGQTFRILQISDIQSNGNKKKDDAAFKMIGEMIEDYAPDMLYIAGDTVSGFLNGSLAKNIISRLDSFEIPYMIVQGNHDAEGFTTAKGIGNIFAGGRNSLYKNGPDNIHGSGNYVVNLKSQNGDILYSFIAFDSNRYVGISEYDKIYPDQIDWYEWAVRSVSTQQYGEYDKLAGKIVPSFAFFHIPLPEYAVAVTANGPVAGGIGEKREETCGPKENTGLFNKMLFLGSTTGVFAGHEHINNFSVDYNGIRLTYGTKTGTNSYHSLDMQGGTLITINNDLSFDVQIILK